MRGNVFQDEQGNYITESELLTRFIIEYQKENKKLKEDINFCLHSIKQEMEMSTDNRTKKEMKVCYDVLKEWENK